MRHTSGPTETHTAAMPSTLPQTSFLTRRNAYAYMYTVHEINVARARDRRASGAWWCNSISVLLKNGAVSEALLPKVFYESTPDFPVHQLRFTRSVALEIIFRTISAERLMLKYKIINLVSRK